MKGFACVMQDRAKISCFSIPSLESCFNSDEFLGKNVADFEIRIAGIPSFMAQLKHAPECFSSREKFEFSFAKHLVSFSARSWPGNPDALRIPIESICEFDQI